MPFWPGVAEFFPAVGAGGEFRVGEEAGVEGFLEGGLVERAADQDQFLATVAGVGVPDLLQFATFHGIFRKLPIGRIGPPDPPRFGTHHRSGL